MTRQNTLVLESRVQHALWRHVVLPEISDGRWRLTPPKKHADFWRECVVIVGSQPGLRLVEGRPKKSNYALNELMRISLDKMKRVARMASVTMSDACIEVAAEWMPVNKYVYDLTAEDPENIDMAIIATVAGDYYGVVYTDEQLRDDLRAISRAMRFMMV
jgi:Asp-tRNA(Asn)/Glu-tRNA(Gln) amidotransferase C subunit